MTPSRHTWFWVMLATGLFAFIIFYELPARRAGGGPARVLPGLKPAEVTGIEVLPRGLELGIQAERTNGGWELTRPRNYPAQTASIERFLDTLANLAPVAHFSERELAANRFNADEVYGFSDPQATLVLKPGGEPRLRVGRRTPTGDQVYLQVVSSEGVYVVDADWLKLIPRTVNDWRDTTLLDLKGLAFDRVSVTNGSKVVELQRRGQTGLWHITLPWSARADSAKIEAALRQLQELRINEFVSDDPKAELENFGLHPPELELTLAHGSNAVATLQLGKTNDAGQLYVRRSGQPAILSVSPELLALWRAPVSEFRSPHLVALPRPVTAIGVQGEDRFSLQRQTNGWRVLPLDFPADTAMVQDLLTNLSGMPIVEFSEDVAAELALPKYGLDTPSRRYSFIWGSTNASLAPTNDFVVELSFGATNLGKVYARRADEPSVYAVKLDDFQRLPAASWQLRERRIWNLTEDDVAAVTIHQEGRTRRLLRKGQYKWSLAPGSNGSISDLAVEETVRGLVQVSAKAWAGQGGEMRARCGFTNANYELQLELKNGEKPEIEFGGLAPSGRPYAAVTLDGKPWVFEFPEALYRDATSYLSVPKP